MKKLISARVAESKQREMSSKVLCVQAAIFEGPDVRVASALQRPAQGLARSEPCNIYDYLRIKDRITQPLDDTQSHTQRLPASVAGRDRGRLLTQDRVDSLPRSDYQKSAMRPAEVGDEQVMRFVRFQLSANFPIVEELLSPVFRIVVFFLCITSSILYGSPFFACCNQHVNFAIAVQIDFLQ